MIYGLWSLKIYAHDLAVRSRSAHTIYGDHLHSRFAPANGIALTICAKRSWSALKIYAHDLRSRPVLTVCGHDLWSLRSQSALTIYGHGLTRKRDITWSGLTIYGHSLRSRSVLIIEHSRTLCRPEKIDNMMSKCFSDAVCVYGAQDKVCAHDLRSRSAPTFRASGSRAGKLGI